MGSLHIKGPVETAKTLKALGITEVALSNNHIFDFGIEGLYDTTKALDAVGISYFGIGNTHKLVGIGERQNSLPLKAVVKDYGTRIKTRRMTEKRHGKI